MQAEMKKILVAVLAACAGCGMAFGQPDAATELRSRIHAGEMAVDSAAGRVDGVAWLRLATFYEDAARFDDAERAFRRAMDLLKAGNRAQYADALDRMGVMYVERGKFGKAEALEQKALSIRREGNDAVAIGRSYMHLALVAYGKRDRHGAEADAEMAVSLLAPEHADEARPEGATPEEKMSALIDLALIQCARGGCEAATHDLERALRLATANYPANSMPVGFLHFLLGYTHTKSGDVQSGMTMMKTGIDEMKTPMGWGHPTYIGALKEYAAELERAGRNDEAGEVEKSIAKLDGSSHSVPRPDGVGPLGMNALR